MFAPEIVALILWNAVGAPGAIVSRVIVSFAIAPYCPLELK